MVVFLSDEEAETFKNWSRQQNLCVEQMGVSGDFNKLFFENANSKLFTVVYIQEISISFSDSNYVDH